MFWRCSKIGVPSYATVYEHGTNPPKKLFEFNVNWPYDQDIYCTFIRTGRDTYDLRSGTLVFQFRVPQFIFAQLILFARASRSVIIFTARNSHLASIRYTIRDDYFPRDHAPVFDGILAGGQMTGPLQLFADGNSGSFEYYKDGVDAGHVSFVYGGDQIDLY